MGLLSYFKKRRAVWVRGTAMLLVLALATASVTKERTVARASGYSIVILTKYSQTLKIGQSFLLAGIASNGKRITWKSSRSGIASVNTYGLVTAKKAGTCRIVGKVSGGEASCSVTVEKTKIDLSAATITMENGDSVTIKGTTSNGSPITWRSKKSSVASIDEKGKITAKKPGESIITAKADGSTGTCRVIVKKPKITLSDTAVSLYRGQKIRLTAKASSGRKVTWKTKKKSVATVTAGGRVTAVKHGTARITASLDGVKKECVVTVRSPHIKLSRESLVMRKGETAVLTASVSSGNRPVWKSSRSGVAVVDSDGRIHARKKGRCLIYASEDGAKASCHVQVTE